MRVCISRDVIQEIPEMVAIINEDQKPILIVELTSSRLHEISVLHQSFTCKNPMHEPKAIIKLSNPMDVFEGAFFLRNVVFE